MRQEKGTVWTLCPRDAEDGLAGAHQGSHSWRDTSNSLISATGFGAVQWVFLSKESPWEGARSRDASVPGCEMGREKQEVKGSLSSRGFGRRLCSCPDPGSG